MNHPFSFHPNVCCLRMRVCSDLVCPQLSAREKELQLLYADMTEEVVSGSDYDDMLANGHLLDVDDTATAAATGTAGTDCALKQWGWVSVLRTWPQGLPVSLIPEACCVAELSLGPATNQLRPCCKRSQAVPDNVCCLSAGNVVFVLQMLPASCLRWSLWARLSQHQSTACWQAPAQQRWLASLSQRQPLLQGSVQPSTDQTVLLLQRSPRCAPRAACRPSVAAAPWLLAQPLPTHVLLLLVLSQQACKRLAGCLLRQVVARPLLAHTAAAGVPRGTASG